MKKLVFGSLFALAASQLVACVASDDTARITVGWEFKEFPNTTTSCPAGFPTIAHYNQPLDEITLAPVGQPIIDLYDCVDGSNFTDSLPPTTIQSWVESTDDSGASVYAQSTSVILDISAQNQAFDVAIFHDAGYFQFGWDLVAASNGAPVSCAQAGADGVEIISTITGTTDAVTDQFNCEDGGAITAALLAGTYEVSIDAFQDGAGALGAPFNLSNRVINAPNKVTDLGIVDLPIDGL